MSELFVFLGGAAVGLAAPWLFGLLGQRRLHAELRAFFGRDPVRLPIVSRSFASVDLPNLQRAIGQQGESRAIGYTSMFGAFQNSLREMVGARSIMTARVGPVRYREVDIDVDEQLQCVENGIHLIRGAGGKIAAHVRTDAMAGGALELEVMALTEEAAAAFLERVRDSMHHANVYRGKILSLEACESEAVPHGRGHGAAGVRFHRFPELSREQIILPEATMALIDRNTRRFFQHAAALRRSGRSVKRGLLLHGKPGTGKTHTARWLAGTMEGVTTILMAGEQLYLIKQCCQLARMLQPALVIMEDVDLVASQRDERRHPASQVTLHQLLNEMDGLTSEAEVIFILTTNRPDAIEPALAARPGRIDQAIEYPLPDADCRRRLLELYGRGLALELAEPERLVARTEGASPAFIQELLRKAALIAAEERSARNGSLRVTDAHCGEALRELLLGGGELTRSLLGFAAEEAGTEGDQAGSGPAPPAGPPRRRGPRPPGPGPSAP
jgi:hypothetical protein